MPPYAGSVTPSGSFGEVRSGEFCDTLNVSGIKQGPNGELRNLQVRSVSSEDGHLLLRHGLHDVVNVDPLATGMRPKTVVDLIRFDELASDVRRTPEKRSKLGGSSSERSATEVTCRSGLTMRVPSPNGPMQCSTSQKRVREMRPPGSSSSPLDSRQAKQSAMRSVFHHRSPAFCGVPQYAGTATQSDVALRGG